MRVYKKICFLKYSSGYELQFKRFLENILHLIGKSNNHFRYERIVSFIIQCWSRNILRNFQIRDNYALLN